MGHSLRRLVDDVTGTWHTMPKSQALRWYGALARHAPEVMRERKLYSADRDMRGKLQFFSLGRTLELEIDDTEAGAGSYAFLREFFVRQIYFRAFSQLNFGSCLDLGCNIGVVSSLLKQLSGPDGRVVGIDALTYPKSIFRTRVASTPGIRIHQGVLCGPAVKEDTAALHAMCERYDFDPRQAITVEELMDMYGLQHIDFMKMDIEGAEFAIFREPEKWLSRVDNLAMEVHNTIGNPEEIIQRLRQEGFRVTWLDDGGYPSEMKQAGYIYASKTGSLKN